MFIGINIAFIVTHATPIDPVEQSIAAATQFGSTNPEAVALMRQSLRELYGLQGGLWDQYLVFWKRVSVGDFGPSLSAFPTPVRTLIGRALPWTVGLLLVSTVISWLLGNLLGGLAGYYRNSKVLWLAGIVAMAFHPIPYYIVAFVLLIVFGFVWPVLPISGGYTMNMQPAFELTFHREPVQALAPAGAIAGIGRSGRLVHGHALAGVEHRDRGLRDLRRTGRGE